MRMTTALWFETALLPDGWANAVAVSIAADGTIAAVAPDAPRAGAEAFAGAAVAGLADLHSHAFQRAMAGLTERRGTSPDSFWTWRETMYRFLARLSPEDVEAIAGMLYAELLEAGFTSVGEFHYLHNAPDGSRYADPAEMAVRIAAAASATGIGLTLLPVFYETGSFGGAPATEGQRRFLSDLDGFARLMEGAAAVVRDLPGAVLGVAPHSLRAVTPAALDHLVRSYGDGPLHIHVAEQEKEVADCLAWSGARPMQWLLANQPVGPRWCAIHATHLVPEETLAFAATGAVAGLCPVTESNLGDGIFDGVRFLGAGGRFGVGTDSNVQISAAAELRTLEYSQRLRDRSRNALATRAGSTGRQLLERALAGGAQALGRRGGALAPGMRADIVRLDPAHPSLAAASADGWIDGWLFSADLAGVGDVWAGGVHLVRQGRHVRREELVARYRRVLAGLLA
jgi:formimidoylglutamate deiminase